MDWRNDGAHGSPFSVNCWKPQPPLWHLPTTTKFNINEGHYMDINMNILWRESVNDWVGVMKKWVCLGTLSREQAWKCVPCEQLLRTSYCMVTVSGNGAYRASWFSNLKCREMLVAHLASPLAWSCSTSLLPLGLRKEQGTRKGPADIDDWKQGNQEWIQGIPKEMLQIVIT